MLAKITAGALLSCLAAMLAFGCVGSTAPSGSIPSAVESQTDAYGAWAELGMIGSRKTVEGELVAVAAESLYVLTDTLIVVPRFAVWQIKLTRFGQEHASMAGWTLLGTIGTISHGFFLIGSMPLWIIGGSLATGQASKEPIVRPHAAEGKSVSMYELTALAAYARFPQGLPRNLDRSTLRPRRR